MQTVASHAEPAHTEVAARLIGAALDVGATTVVIAPYFLGPGSPWDRDTPTVAAEASAGHPDVRYLVTAPLGPHPLLTDIVEHRIRYCLSRTPSVTHQYANCDGTRRCRLL